MIRERRCKHFLQKNCAICKSGAAKQTERADTCVQIIFCKPGLAGGKWRKFFLYFDHLFFWGGKKLRQADVRLGEVVFNPLNAEKVLSYFYVIYSF